MARLIKCAADEQITCDEALAMLRELTRAKAAVNTVITIAGNHGKFMISSAAVDVLEQLDELYDAACDVKAKAQCNTSNGN